MTRVLVSFVIGGLLGAAVMGVVCMLTPGISIFERAPEQIPFDSPAWLSGDARLRGHMYQAAIAYLEAERPTQDTVLRLLGPSGYRESAYLNGAEHYLVYQIDLGQRISSVPFLNKLGVAFHQDGTYSHVSTWD
jgi:hypothetical protein